MIAKHVPMRVLRKSSMAELVGYLTDQHGLTERVGDIRITHCEAATLGAAVSEMLAVQQLNTRAQSDLTYHLLVSFPAGEHPLPETLAAIEERLCKALGFEGHQRISVVHHDTDHLHMHISINKVHPQRLTLKEPYLAYKTLAVMCERLEREHGLQAVNHTPRRGVGEGKAADMEQHAAVESLMSWVRRECLDLVHAATTWQELHQVLADHGLELRERSAGLVFASRDGTFVKASTVDRGLSKKALETRLGAFQAPVSLAQPWASKSYRQGPMRSRVDTTELYARYRAQREAVGDQRAEALGVARRRKAAALAAAKRAYALQRAAIRLSDGKGIDKRLVYATASYQMRQRLQAIYRGYEAERAEILKNHQHQAWADWLKAEAVKGNSEALAALRARTEASNLRGHTVRAQGLTGATGASPEVENVTKAGTVVYRAGTSAVRDDGRRLQVSRAADHDAVQAALKLARERYGDRVTVSGSQRFRSAVVRAAVELALPVAFTDPGLERQRQALIRKEPPHGTDERRGPDRRDDGRPRRADRSGTEAAGAARHAHGRKPNPGGAPKGAPPRSRHRVRDVPERDVAGQRAGRELLLPGDVRHGVEQQGAQAPDALRRPVDRAGRAGGVSRPPVGRPGSKAPPKAEARLRTGAGVGVRAPTAPRPAPAAPAWQMPGAKLAPQAYAAADSYIEEREGKRARGIDVPRHMRYSPTKQPLSFAGLRSVDGCTLALLDRGDAVLVMPVELTTVLRLKAVSIGQSITVTPTGSLAAGHSRGRSQ